MPTAEDYYKWLHDAAERNAREKAEKEASIKKILNEGRGTVNGQNSRY